MKTKQNEGFTLIELLIVVAIIAILAAIAIPQFANYRKKGYNASANSDLRNIRTSEEAMAADYQDYGVSQDTDLAGGAAGNGTDVTGTTVYLVGAFSTSKPNIRVSLSPSVRALVKTSGTVDTTRSDAYTAGSAHGSGDQHYAAASHTADLVRRGDEDETALNIMINGATAGSVPTGNNWIGVQ